jgi:hypothetical protein
MLKTDTGPLVRLLAAEALHFITGTKAVVPAFIEALRHPDVEVWLIGHLTDHKPLDASFLIAGIKAQVQ